MDGAMMPLLLLLSPWLQEPAAEAPPPDPARLRWEAVQKQFREAEALRIRSTVVLSDPKAEAEEARTLRVAVEADLLRPSAGRILVDGEQIGPGDEREALRVLYLGDGERVYQVDDEARSAFPECAAWAECSAMFFLSYLGPEWSGELLAAEQIAFLPAREDHPDWVGIGLTGPDLFGDSSTAEAWLDAQGRLRAFSLPIGGTARLLAEVGTLELLAEADAAAFVHRVPEAYDVAAEVDFNEGLLKVGAAAPEATLIGMDDVEFALSSLRGKTVLLNFWFFH